MKKLEVKQFDISEVDEATLLPVEEARKLQKSIRACGEWWWLRSPGSDQDRAAYAGYGVAVYEHGSYVRDASIAVRPAFRISNLESKIGDKIMIGKTWCTIIDEGLVLADSPVCEHRFDSKSNNWESSELKEFINSEEFKKMI